MKSFLSSPIATSVSNIASVNIHKRSSFKTKKDYSDFITWLDTSNNDIRKIKLPSKKKLKDLEDLDFSSMLGGGNPLAALLGEILGGLAASLGISSLNNSPTFGKTTRTSTSTPTTSGGMSGGIGGIPLISKINVKDITNKTKLLPSKPNLLPETKIKGLLPSSESRAQTKLLPEKPKISQPGKGFASSHPDITGQGDFGKRADKILEERRAARLAKDGTKGATKNIATGGKVAKAFGKFGASIIPGIGAVVGAADATLRAQSGDTTGASIAGAGAGLDAFAAAAAATGIGLPLAGLASILSFGLDVTNLIRDLSGASDKEKPKEKSKEKPKDKIDTRLKAQEKKQREAASASNVTFVSITDKFDKVVSKFEKIKFGVSGVQNKDNANGEMEDSNSIEPTDPIDTGNKPEPTGLKLEDVEASGGEVPGRPDSPFGQKRGNHIHQGNDYSKSAGTPISLIQEGTVAVANMNYDPGGWGAVVEVRHRDGSLSRYAHLSKISVAAGSKITPGQVIGYTGGAAGAPGSGNSTGPHLHFEYLPAGSGQVDPTEAAKRIFRFGGNVKVKAKKGENKGPQGMADIRGSAPDTKQQSIEDFAKQTMGKERADRILKDPKLKEQLSGGKQGSDREIKQLKENYNVYVRGIRERRQAQIAPGQTPQVPEAITTPLQEQTSTSTILLGQSQSAAQPSMVPVPIPMGGGGGGNGGGVAVISLSEGQILNSLWKIMLLTNLSSA